MTQLALTLPDRACRGCARPLDDPGLCRLCVAGLSVCEECRAEFPTEQLCWVGFVLNGPTEGRREGAFVCPRCAEEKEAA